MSKPRCQDEIPAAAEDTDQAPTVSLASGRTGHRRHGGCREFCFRFAPFDDWDQLMAFMRHALEPISVNSG